MNDYERTQNVGTLGELFNRSPKELNREARDSIILKFREAREKWVLERNAAKSEGRRTKSSAGLSSRVAKQVEIPDALSSIKVEL